MTSTLRIEPDGPFSLAAAAAFGFGPRTAHDLAAGETMRLAFVADDLSTHAAVLLRQEPGGAVDVRVEGDADAAAVDRQVRRILSLDHPGSEWVRVGERDPVLGRLGEQHGWLRPVLFHSPYEAAAWSVLSHRRQRPQSVALRQRLSEERGRVFELDGETIAAFPLPAALLELDAFAGLDDVRLGRLREVARAALDGRLDAERLAGLEPEAALAELQTIPGIGPFYAALVLVRASGAADVLAADEPRFLAALAHFYGLAAPPSRDELLALAEPWRPFRTWASVLIRAAGDRAGLQAGAGRSTRSARR